MDQPATVVASRFVLEREIGSGGMGVVHRALDRETGEPVALKLLRLDAIDEAPRFAREGRLLRELSHPAIVRYVDHGVTPEGVAYLAMQWLEGEDLLRHIARRQLPVADTLTVARRVASALGAAHARGVVHRDVKPSNVYLPGRSLAEAVLLDFGVARELGAASATKAGVVVGTPAYLAPEQALAERVIDARADVFALGTVLYRCLAGRTPFAAEDTMGVLARVVLDTPRRLDELRLDVPAPLADLVAEMLAKERADRPRDGSEVLARLDALLELTLPSRTDAPAEERASGRVTVELPAPPASDPASPAISTEEQRIVCVVAARALPRSSSPVDGVPLAESIAGLVAASGGVASALADGTVLARFEGDGGSTTDLARRAARCALGLRDGARGLAVALATGRALARASAATGEAVERAVDLLRAALRAPADAADVWLDPLTAGLLGADFVRDQVRGTPVLRREHITRGIDVLMGKATPCVGRDAELATLAGLLAATLADGTPRAALVSGAPGAGKSRLVRELLARSVGEARVWIARADAVRLGVPRALAADLVRSAAGLRDGMPPAMRARVLRAHVRALFDEPAEAARVTELLGELVGTALEGEPSLALVAARRDAQSMADQIASAWVRWLGRASRARPVVLVLEDVHWADRGSLALVDRALGELGEASLFVLATARPEVHDAHPGLWSARGLTQLALRDLPPRAAAALVRASLGAAVSDSRVARLVERAGGNPFFLEEIIRAAAAEPDAEAAPATVLAMLSGRLSRLPPEARRVLRAACIFGEVFWDDAVAALLGEDAERGSAGYWLDRLVDQELVVARTEGRFTTAREYAFRHALLRDAAYETLTDADRALGHRAAARWLASAGGSEPLVIAEHFEAGAEPAEAIPWYVRAAEDALAASDLDAARARAERGLACGAMGTEEGALRLALAEVHRWSGAWTEVAACARQALDVLPRGSASWFHAASRGAWAAAVTGAPLPLATLAHELLEMAPPQTLDARAAMVIAATRVVAGLARMGGDRARVEALLERLDELAGGPLSDDPGVAGHVHYAAAAAAWSAGDVSSYLERTRRALEQATRADSRRQACALSAEVAFGLMVLGDYRAAVPELVRARASAESLGLRTVAASATHNLGLALALSGDPARGMQEELAAVEAFRAQGDARMEATARVYAALIALTVGDDARASAEARAAVELAPTQTMRAFGRGVWSAAALRLGQVEAALELGRTAYAESDAIGDAEEGAAFVASALAEALERSGDLEGAREVAARALAQLERAAARISDADARRGFLARVPDHDRLLRVARSLGVPELSAPRPGGA